MVPWAHPSPQHERHLARFRLSHSCRPMRLDTVDRQTCTQRPCYKRSNRPRDEATRRLAPKWVITPPPKVSKPRAIVFKTVFTVVISEKVLLWTKERVVPIWFSGKSLKLLPPDVRLKCTKLDVGWGSGPDLTGGWLQRSPRPSSWI